MMKKSLLAAVVATLARERGLSSAEMAALTSQNATRLFGLPA